MLFKARFHDGIRQGEVTVAFRQWETARVRPGGRYRFGGRHAAQDYLLVDALDVVAPARITAAEARAAGYASRAELLADLEHYAGPDTRLYRVAFHYDRDQTDPRTALREDLSPAGLDAVMERLDRMDRYAPWTRAVLTLIRDQPRVAASRLAPQLGRETLPFKADVHKLKNLGLTISHEVGYELSPRGRAVLARREAAGTARG